MKRIRIPGTRFECSKFIFGTASLFNAGSRQRRVGLLEAAVDHGFTHFDTASYYGFGVAEREAFQAHFEILSEVRADPDLGIQYLTDEVQGELSAYSREELLTNHLMFVLRPRRG